MIRSHTFRIISLTILSLLIVLTSGCTPLLTKTDPDFIEPLTSMDFVFVEGGTFKMGDHSGKMQRELPVHEVTLPGFAVGMYEVTFTQYDEFCEATNREKPSDEGWGRGSRPVINVNWDDANAYAEWLSKETGLSFSLPSEAQWEYFARAGSSGKYWTGWRLPKNRANCEDCGSQWDNQMTAPVGSFKPNQWGLYDTAGNVHEWCLDTLHRNYQGAPLDGQPWPGGDEKRVINRGGAWDSYQRYLYSFARDWATKKTYRKNIGFRLVMKQLVATPQ